MSAGGWIFSILATIVFLALIAALIYWLLYATTSAGSPRGDSRESPKEVLDRRLASGELTVEQYRQLREALAAPPQPPIASHGPQPPPPQTAGSSSG